MENRRVKSPKDFPLRLDGQNRPLCRFCGHLLSPPRRTFCSNGCVNAYLAATSPSHLRAQVFRRDKGICALCRADTAKIKRVLDYLRAGLRLGFDGSFLVKPDEEAAAWYVAELAIPAARLGGELWDADHVRPVVEGGESCLSNMRTLCIPCHRRETYKLTQRMAAKRKGRVYEGRPNLQHTTG